MGIIIAKPIGEAALEVLGDIFSNTERTDKITVVLDEFTKEVRISYDDLDCEWFKELTEAVGQDSKGK
jgi:hypothetical protein